jgi:GDP-L-fucose synthase
MFEGKNVLVAGGTGFLGSHFVDEFARRGAKVHATFLNTWPLHRDDVEYIRADLTNPQKCKEVVKDMDYVIMCAAVTHGAAVIRSDPMSLVIPSSAMNSYMLDAAHKAGVRKFLFISSSVVYPYGFATEDRAFIKDPPDVYYHVGWMKRYAEKLCQAYSQKVANPMTCIVVRPGNCYGPRDHFDPELSHVTASIIHKVAERNDPIEIWGDGNDKRDVIYIDDFIEGALLAFEKLDTFETVNIATGLTYSVNEILATALEVDGYNDAKVIYNSNKPSTIRVREIDTLKAYRLLGFEAKTSLEDGIRKTIEWYRHNRE